MLHTLQSATVIMNDDLESQWEVLAVAYFKVSSLQGQRKIAITKSHVTVFRIEIRVHNFNDEKMC